LHASGWTYNVNATLPQAAARQPALCMRIGADPSGLATSLAGRLVLANVLIADMPNASTTGLIERGVRCPPVTGSVCTLVGDERS